MSLAIMSPFPYTRRSRSLIRNRMNQTEIWSCFHVGEGYILTSSGVATRNLCSCSAARTTRREQTWCSRDAKAEMHRAHAEGTELLMLCDICFLHYFQPDTAEKSHPPPSINKRRELNSIYKTLPLTQLSLV